MKLEDFDYFLPKELIAQHAVKPKDHSRFLVVNKGNIEHKHFYDLIDYLNKDDVLVMNETRVSRVKITGKKITGSKVEIILEKKINDSNYECRVTANKVRIGNKYIFTGGLEAEVVGKNEDIFFIRFNKPITQKIKESLFELPLPPYVHEKIKEDSEYQTVYSSNDGSLAAPTAGLHFTNELLKKIEKKGVKIAKLCLHVGFGTFLPIRGELEKHKMHNEYFEIAKENADLINNRKGRLIVVGTTSVRALESSTENGKVIPAKSSTEIFIYPGYKFKNEIDALITNFHLPKSTLLMLVSAYYRREEILKIYSEAVKNKYRFFSLGDAMMLIK
jgi:S-adenosylmethionine:tRNA ribosyltransferase-isomerase